MGVKIMETILRDAHQSLIATRMPTEEMLPIVDTMDQVGYHAVECWGGATFDSCLRFLHEDPWDRLRKLRDGFKHTKLQMLFRGQNILGYKPYADDVVEYFVQKSVANGIDIIRIFDCMNDLRNLQTCVDAAKKEKGAEAQVSGFHLHQGYGRSSDALPGNRAGKGSERDHEPSHRASHTLYIRCRFHDLSEGCGGRCGYH